MKGSQVFFQNKPFFKGILNWRVVAVKGITKVALSPCKMRNACKAFGKYRKKNGPTKKHGNQSATEDVACN